MQLDELLTVQTWFFDRLRELQAKEWHQSFLSFLKTLTRECNRTYFFQKNKPYIRIYNDNDTIRIVDETEKIDVLLTPELTQRFHNILKDTWTMKWISSNQSILEWLLEEYRQWNLKTIAGKPYLVYDIETTFGEWKGQYFEMSYDISSSDNHESELLYTYVDRTNMKELADRLLAYDWWIIWYNNIWFDNPVLLKNCGYTQEQIETLNKKSIDPFLVIHKLTWRRMSLNNLASALIWSWKTLSSWAEWEELLKQYKETWNARLLTKVKDYCKNDVEITLWVMLYLLSYKKLQFDWKTHNIDDEMLRTLWWWTKEQEEWKWDDLFS